jgi:hypothetical protein
MKIDIKFNSNNHSMNPEFSNSIPAGGGGTDVIVNGEVVPIFNAHEFAKNLPQTVIKKDTWGYYFAAIDIENKVIYLSEQQGEKAAVKPVIIPTEA